MRGTYYVLGMVLGAGDSDQNRQKPMTSWQMFLSVVNGQ